MNRPYDNSKNKSICIHLNKNRILLVTLLLTMIILAFTSIASYADDSTITRNGAAGSNTSNSVATNTNTNTAPSIGDILVSDQANDGYVMQSNVPIPKRPRNIYITVTVNNGVPGIQVIGSLTSPTNRYTKPITIVTKMSGNIEEGFQFTAVGRRWQSGQYRFDVLLSTGASTSINFDIK